MAAKRADKGMVKSQPITIFLATPQRTAESLLVAPTPMIEPEIA